MKNTKVHTENNRFSCLFVTFGDLVLPKTVRDLLMRRTHFKKQAWFILAQKHLYNFWRSEHLQRRLYQRETASEDAYFS